VQVPVPYSLPEETELVPALEVAVTEYDKIGRLLPAGEVVLIVVDGQGEIGSVTPGELSAIALGLGPVQVSPVGTVDRSVTGRSIWFTIPGQPGVVCMVSTKQVRNLLDQYPRKKAAVFAPVE